MPITKANCVNSKSEVVTLDNTVISKFRNNWIRLGNYIGDQQEDYLFNSFSFELPSLESKLEDNLNYSQLYEQDIKKMLRKWDYQNSDCNIIYKKLSLQQRTDLLSQIAFKTFEKGKYLFEQEEIEQYIAEYICNLPDIRNNPGVLKQESAAVLKSIETQHGLLLQSKPGIYSFLNIALHKYLIAKYIVNASEPQLLENNLKYLVSNLTKTCWHEVFLLVVSMLPNTDYLLRLIKQQTNALIASDPELEYFLLCNNHKYVVGQNPYKPEAVRALSLGLILKVSLDFACRLDDSIVYDLKFNPAALYTYKDYLPDSQFSKHQKHILKQYYNANKLLVECLNNAHYVSRTLREQIQETLLIPCYI